jgi:hypothetical protein
MVLYVPFGAFTGFVTVALTFLATQHGLSISEGALLNGAQMLTSWLKWLWAPAVDITLTPKRWYVISTAASALGVLGMSIVPLEKETLWLLLLVIAAASLINSVVGMSVEAMIASLTPPDEVGRVSAWFQAGNLGGAGLGGGLGLFLFQKLPASWMSGAIVGALFIACCLALLPLPFVKAHERGAGVSAAVKGVAVGLWEMLKTRAGFLSALLCVLPVSTGAAQGTLTQAAVAAFWGAGEREVELVQGLFSGLITAIGCFGGGWLCKHLNPRAAYAFFGLVLAAVASLMAVCPHTINMYVVWNLIYAFGVGLAYAAFTAVALSALGKAAAATGYNIFASLSNFPIWWLGLLLGTVADKHGPSAMLFTEAAFGVLGVIIFVVATRAAGQTLLGRTSEQIVSTPVASTPSA